VAFSLGFVPEYRSPKYLAAKKEQQNIKETAQQLSDFTKRTLEKKPPVQPSAREALESAEKLGMDLAKNPTTRAEALKDLAKATDKIKQELKEMGKNPSLRSLERNMRQNSNQRSGSGNSAEMQKKMDSLQKAMEAKKTSPDAMEKLQQEMEKARDSAKAMAGNDSPEAAAARQQLAQTLASLSQQAQNMGIDPGKLDEAIAALQANQVDTFLKEMDQALNDLEKLQELAKNLEAMKNDAAGKLGKDLAEQLKFGQAEAAAETLRKMAEQLKSGRMSKEEMKKIADELSNAMDPAGQYGDVAKHLQEAMQKMAKDKAGEGSSESLAKAADELEKLLQQAADAESLMATLSALQKASQCIGNGMGWGQCQTPGSRPGGKPGRGVGTWATENGWENFADAYQDAGFDNSEIQRPDMDGRGVSDRGEGELNPNLQPTKVKGQMSPGGPMPSVSIKGLSIKGQSKVSYKEAVQAAQNEAESAIQDEKVPRAYRGAVRDYFDDLKQ
jgi:tetratricopeptide (TPR) repeat protein